jgi:hypothetical protein
MRTVGCWGHWLAQHWHPHTTRHYSTSESDHTLSLLGTSTRWACEGVLSPTYPP